MCSGARAIGAIVFSPLAQGLLTDKYLRRRAGGLARPRAACTSPRT